MYSVTLVRDDPNAKTYFSGKTMEEAIVAAWKYEAQFVHRSYIPPSWDENEEH